MLVSERPFTLRELLATHAEGRLAEVFGECVWCSCCRPAVAWPLPGQHADTASSQSDVHTVAGCGTACVVTPVGCVVTADGAELRLPGASAGDGGSGDGADGSGDSGSGDSGSIAGWARSRLTDIQYGRVPHPWSVPFE